MRYIFVIIVGSFLGEIFQMFSIIANLISLLHTGLVLWSGVQWSMCIYDQIADIYIPRRVEETHLFDILQSHRSRICF